jgi:hypothetical protein
MPRRRVDRCKPSFPRIPCQTSKQHARKMLRRPPEFILTRRRHSYRNRLGEELTGRIYYRETIGTGTRGSEAESQAGLDNTEIVSARVAKSADAKDLKSGRASR